jgi:hypothetical protein
LARLPTSLGHDKSRSSWALAKAKRTDMGWHEKEKSCGRPTPAFAQPPGANLTIVGLAGVQWDASRIQSQQYREREGVSYSPRRRNCNAPCRRHITGSATKRRSRRAASGAVKYVVKLKNPRKDVPRSPIVLLFP